MTASLMVFRKVTQMSRRYFGLNVQISSLTRVIDTMLVGISSLPVFIWLVWNWLSFLPNISQEVKEHCAMAVSCLLNWTGFL